MVTLNIKSKIVKKKRVRPVYSPVHFRQIESMWKNITPYGRRKRILLSILYLSGARISEIRQLRKKDFKIVLDKDGVELLILNMVTLKNRENKFRTIVLKKVSDYAPMINEIESYLKHLDEHERVFTQSTRTLRRWVADLPEFTTTAVRPGVTESYDVTRKWYPHFFRHCRLTHLVEYHHFDAIRLMNFAGWSSPILANVYIRLDWKNLADLIEEGQIPNDY